MFYFIYLFIGENALQLSQLQFGVTLCIMLCELSGHIPGQDKNELEDG